jgi:hypothetical protein
VVSSRRVVLGVTIRRALRSHRSPIASLGVKLLASFGFLARGSATTAADLLFLNLRSERESVRPTVVGAVEAQSVFRPSAASLRASSSARGGSRSMV